MKLRTSLGVLAAPVLSLALLTLVPGARAAEARPQEAPAPAVAEEAREPVTVVLVRHAEKSTAKPEDRDPALSEAGAERAVALARLLEKAGVTHVFASEYLRTRETVAPLALAAGLDVEIVSAREPDRQVAALRELAPGSVAVVAGHSNTVPGLVAALGGEVADLVEHPRHGPMLGDDEYDRLFVVTLPVGAAARAKSLELQYGR